MKHQLAIWMGIIIAVLDIYWTYISISYAVGLALGVLIFIADVVWLYLDW